MACSFKNPFIIFRCITQSFVYVFMKHGRLCSLGGRDNCVTGMCSNITEKVRMR